MTKPAAQRAKSVGEVRLMLLRIEVERNMHITGAIFLSAFLADFLGGSAFTVSLRPGRSGSASFL